MPFYDYTCPACEHTEEIFHGMKSSVSVTCPKCHTQRLTKTISPVHAHFKGKGWSSDGYA